MVSLSTLKKRLNHLFKAPFRAFFGKKFVFVDESDRTGGEEHRLHIVFLALPLEAKQRNKAFFNLLGLLLLLYSIRRLGPKVKRNITKAISGKSLDENKGLKNR